MKEKIKSAALTLLIVSSIFLTIKIWVGEKLWFDDYNFFSDFGQFFSPNKNVIPTLSQSSPTKSILALPEKIIINKTGQRLILSKKSDRFTVLWDDIKLTVQPFLENVNKSLTPITESIWKESLTGNCVYVDFGTNYSTHFLSCVYNFSYSSTEYIISEFIIKMPVENFDYYTILIKTSAVNEYLQFYADSASSELLSSTNSFEEKDNTTKQFSFELNFDTPISPNANFALEEKVIINSMTLLNLEESQYNVITSSNPLKTKSNGAIDEEMVNSVVALFGMNPHTIRKYTDEDGSATFLENYCSLTIHANGYIEYHVTDESATPPMTDSTQSLYQSTMLATGFIDKLVSKTASHDNFVIKTDIAENVHENIPFNLKFDYQIDSSVVILEGQADNDEKTNSAIEIEIKNNKLISYKHFLRSYNQSETFSSMPTSIAIIDGILSSKKISLPLQVEDMYVAYYDDGVSSNVYPGWYVSLPESTIFLKN